MRLVHLLLRLEGCERGGVAGQSGQFGQLLHLHALAEALAFGVDGGAFSDESGVGFQSLKFRGGICGFGLQGVDAGLVKLAH